MPTFASIAINEFIYGMTDLEISEITKFILEFSSITFPIASF